MDSTIWEDFTLPSKGLIYDKPINPHISLRSMTIMEDMKRQSKSEQQFKTLSDMIEDCCKEKPDTHIYNLCMGDYTYLLHKLRIISQGSEYRLQCLCPHCGKVVNATCDLETLKIKEYDNSIDSLKMITLPVSNKNIELKFITPRDKDIIDYMNKERQKETKTSLNFAELFTCMAYIKSVDGRKLNQLELEEFVKGLYMKDINYLIVAGTKLDKSIGVDTSIDVTCSYCGGTFPTSFRYTAEFFGPCYD